MQKQKSQRIESFSVLVEKAASLLLKKRNYKAKTVNQYRNSWRKVEDFMASSGYTDYGPDVEKAYMAQRYGVKPLHDLPISDRLHIQRIALLTEFCRTGDIQATRDGRKLLVKIHWPFKPGPFSELVESACAALSENRRYRFKTIARYRTSWRSIERFMASRGIRDYSKTVEEAYLMDLFGDRAYHTLSIKDKEHVNRVRLLTEFRETGEIKPVVKETCFSGEIGASMEGFLSEKKAERVCSVRIRSMEIHLYTFLSFIQQKGVFAINGISQRHIYGFLLELDSRQTSLPRTVIDILRPYFRYLYGQGLSSMDLARLIPKHNYKTQSVLPSLYSKEEIESILSSIRRDDPVGKRDYALVLLAARLGMRASDICNLKFSDIDWEKCTVTFNQLKTGNKNVLPLIEEVGLALIDYIRHGRPLVPDCPNIFLRAAVPYRQMDISTLYNIVNESFRAAGINTRNKHHGPHSLRHSLVGRLLEEHTSFPVVSEILGHQRMETTRYYVRIDLTSMRQFALEVPPVSPSFYSQKGGFFHE